VARTPQGLVRGFVLNGTKVWRGVRYAAPPVGDLRFRPPQPPAPWDGVLETADFGASCMQMGSPGATRYGPAWNSLNLTHSSEDCLFLNVYSPDRHGLLLPVMVYLHAGEFRFGASNDQESNWPYFAHGSAVLVTANVRLGFFGFAALDALRPRDPAGSTGNYGMQDQRAVLAWVRQSAASFGGDPERVTIFGESSGGTSVAFHVLSQRSRGLLHRAILQSPGLTQSKPWRDMEGNTQYAASALTAAGGASCAWPAEPVWRGYPGLQASGMPLAKAASLAEARRQCEARADCYLVSAGRGGAAELFGYGLGSGSAAFLFNVTQSLGHNPGVELQVRVAAAEALAPCLLAASAKDLTELAISVPYDDTFNTDAAAPTEDGVELAAPLAELARGPAPPGVALLAGSNLDEGTMFMSECPAIACNASEEQFKAWAVKAFGQSLGAQVPAAYSMVEQPAPLCRQRGPGSHTPGSTSRWWQAAMRSAGDDAILCRTRELLRATHQAGNRVWWYYFTATPIYSINEDPAELPYMGAFHGADVPYVFGDNFELRSDGERALSRAMGCYWVNFAATGNPNEGPSGCAAGLALPRWPALGKEGDAIQFSNTTLSTRQGLKKQQCDMFAHHRRSASESLLVV